MDPELDRNISDHVLRMHRYRSPTEQDGDGEMIRIKHDCAQPLIAMLFGNQELLHSWSATLILQMKKRFSDDSAHTIRDIMKSYNHKPYELHHKKTCLHMRQESRRSLQHC